MAIASIVLHSTGSLSELEKALQALPGFVDATPVPPDKLAVTIESPAEKLPETLKQAASLPAVWNMELVYANYEDDLDEEGFMTAPAGHLIKKQ